MKHPPKQSVPPEINITSKAPDDVGKVYAQGGGYYAQEFLIITHTLTIYVRIYLNVMLVLFEVMMCYFFHQAILLTVFFGILK